MRLFGSIALFIAMSLISFLSIGIEDGKGFQAPELKKVRAISNSVLVSQGRERKKEELESALLKKSISELRALVKSLEPSPSSPQKKSSDAKISVNQFESSLDKALIKSKSIKNSLNKKLPMFFEFWKSSNSKTVHLRNALEKIENEISELKLSDDGSRNNKLRKLKERVMKNNYFRGFELNPKIKSLPINSSEIKGS